MKTLKQIYDETQNRVKNRTPCTHQEYVNMLVNVLIDTVSEHKKEIKLQKEEIQTLIEFIGKEQYIRFKNKGLNYRG